MPEPWKTQELGIADGLIPILSLLDAFDGAPDPVDPAEATAGNRPLQPRRIVMDGSSSPLQPGQGTSIAYVAREQGYVLPHRDSEETESTMDFADMLSALGGDNRLPEFGELRVEFAHPVATTHGWSRPVVWTVHLSNGWLMFVFHDAETLAVDIRAFDWSTNYHYTSEHAVADVSGLALAFDTDGFAVRTLVGGEWRTAEQQGWLTIPWGHGEGERPPYGYYPTYPSFRAQPMLHNWSMEEDLEVTRIVWDAHLPAGEGSATAP
jgi:hypothetical protein